MGFFDSDSDVDSDEDFISSVSDLSSEQDIDEYDSDEMVEISPTTHPSLFKQPILPTPVSQGRPSIVPIQQSYQPTPVSQGYQPTPVSQGRPNIVPIQQSYQPSQSRPNIVPIQQSRPNIVPISQGYQPTPVSQGRPNIVPIQQSYVPIPQSQYEMPPVETRSYILIDVFSPYGMAKRPGSTIEYSENPGEAVNNVIVEDININVPKKKQLSYYRDLEEAFMLSHSGMYEETLDKLTKCYVNSIATGCKYPSEIQAFA